MRNKHLCVLNKGEADLKKCLSTQVFFYCPFQGGASFVDLFGICFS